MELHNVQITKVYKNNIEYNTLKKKVNKKLYSMLLLLMVPVLAMGCLRLYSETTLKDIYTNVCNLYNPIYSPYAETGNILFAGNFEDNIIDLELPIISSVVKVEDDGTIVAMVKESILVKSVADGVVINLEVIDGVKCVKIMYSDSVSVEYINLDVIGVQEGNIVKRGKEIGTAKLGEEVKFKAYFNDKQIKGITIENNKIVWQN